MLWYIIRHVSIKTVLWFLVLIFLRYHLIWAGDNLLIKTLLNLSRLFFNHLWFCRLPLIKKDIRVLVFFHFELVYLLFIASEAFLLYFWIADLIDILIVEFIPFLLLFDKGVIMSCVCISRMYYWTSEMKLIVGRLAFVDNFLILFPLHALNLIHRLALDVFTCEFRHVQFFRKL